MSWSRLLGSCIFDSAALVVTMSCLVVGCFHKS